MTRAYSNRVSRGSLWSREGSRQWWMRTNQVENIEVWQGSKKIYGCTTSELDNEIEKWKIDNDSPNYKCKGGF